MEKNRRVKVSGTHRDYDLDVSEPEHTIARERDRTMLINSLTREGDDAGKPKKKPN
jgi:hypothetical protein